MADDKKKTTIEATKNGSFKVTNLPKLLNSRGDNIPVRETIWLCRCGGSENKPFCDGRHLAAGFDDEKDPERVPYRWKDYRGKNITVHDNRGLCSHSAECTNNLPTVFDTEKRPWINADGDDVGKISAAVKKCPSGALTYTLDNETVAEFGGEPMIRIAKNGPLNVSGGIEFISPDGEQPGNKDHYALCRCGASKNKPFCDGSHLIIKFKDEKN